MHSLSLKYNTSYESHSKGHAGETLALAYLKMLGDHIIERNYKSPLGEIDLISTSQGVVRFCEVKSRTYKIEKWPDVSRETFKPLKHWFDFLHAIVYGQIWLFGWLCAVSHETSRPEPFAPEFRISTKQLNRIKRSAEQYLIISARKQNIFEGQIDSIAIDLDFPKKKAIIRHTEHIG